METDTGVQSSGEDKSQRSWHLRSLKGVKGFAVWGAVFRKEMWLLPGSLFRIVAVNKGDRGFTPKALSPGREA